MAEPLRVVQADDILRPIPPWQLEREPPRREWMVEGCFAKATVAMLSGDGGVGKSLLMQQLATSACLGLPWLGLSVTPGRALYLGCEDDEDELHRRDWAICRSLDRHVTDANEGGLVLVSRVGMDNALTRRKQYTTEMQPTELFLRVGMYCRRAGISYVVIDTATQCFAGNQNDEQQVVQFINMLRRLAIAIQGLVILTKHPSLSGRASGTGESGNTAWNNSVRARLYMTWDGEKSTKLRGMKQNYGERLKPFELRYDRGVFVRDEPEPPKNYYDTNL